MGPRSQTALLTAACLDKSVSACLSFLRHSAAIWSDQPVFTAVSGGPDSMALCDVVDRVCRMAGHPHQALIIDHGLRANSADEAHAVLGQLQARGISAVCLTVSAPPAVSGKMEWARQQRFNLLTSYVQDKGGILMFGHHIDDQAETVAMRLAHGTGLVGAGGILPARLINGVVCVRPFLCLPKNDLIDYCAKAGLKTVSDPTNKQTAYERVRIRNFLAREASFPAQLIRLGRATRALTSVMTAQADIFWARHCHITPLMTSIAFAAFCEAPPILQMHLIRQAVLRHGAPDYPPSEASLTNTILAVCDQQTRTISGCLLRPNGQLLQIGPEFGRQDAFPASIEADSFIIFDRRWLIHSTHHGKIVRLGSAGWAQRDKLSLCYQALRGVPAAFGQMIPLLHPLDAEEVTPHFGVYGELLALYQSKWRHDARQSGVGKAPKMTVFSLPRLSECAGALMTTGFKT
jgi:tRNA(Ile)-lysidine synthase